jgi:uncharacterized protein YbjT (DUF2867 family)
VSTKSPRPGALILSVNSVGDILVIDTNVLVSALLKADSAPATVVRSLLAGDALFAYDARILLEYRAVLSRPRFSFSPILVDQLLRYLTDSGLAMAASHRPGRYRYPIQMMPSSWKSVPRVVAERSS